MFPRPHIWLTAAFLLALAACDSKPRPNPFDPPPDAPKKVPAEAEAKKPSGPPELAIDSTGAKVGFTRAFLDKPDGRENLKRELESVRKDLEGKRSPLIVDRKAKIEWVATYLSELAAIGVEHVAIRTETRTDYPGELDFVPKEKVSNPPPCSVVGMVLEDRATAIWTLSGGTARKRKKGLAGPDLTMTGETIESVAKNCKESSLFFVAAPGVIEWGLAYDLAASTKRLEKASFERFVVLEPAPTPGHRVELL